MPSSGLRGHYMHVVQTCASEPLIHIKSEVEGCDKHWAKGCMNSYSMTCWSTSWRVNYTVSSMRANAPVLLRHEKGNFPIKLEEHIFQVEIQGS